MEGYLTIGRLAAEAGLSTDTIRYYEAIGLLPIPARSATGYRLYPRAEVRRLRLIKRAKLLGLPLGEIRNLVEQTYTGSCAHLRQELMHRIPNQIAEIERRIAELRALQDELEALRAHLAGLDARTLDQPVAECEHCPCITGAERR